MINVDSKSQANLWNWVNVHVLCIYLLMSTTKPYSFMLIMLDNLFIIYNISHQNIEITEQYIQIVKDKSCKSRALGVRLLATIYHLQPSRNFHCVIHNFRHFLPILWHYSRHVVYRRILYTIMQHYMPIKLWTVIAAKMVVHDDTDMQRYIAAEYTMLHNIV